VRGYLMTKEQYQQRLTRIAGQIRGLQRLIGEDADCIDVLQQISAATGALHSLAIGLLDEHVGHSVTRAAEGGDPQRAREMVTEATRSIERLIRA
jgi:CsoR family transcriptional regulator, copper-sensing transcriptional repressor